MQRSVRLCCKNLQNALATLTHINDTAELPSVSISENLASVCRTSNFGNEVAVFWLDDPDEWTRSSQILVIAFA